MILPPHGLLIISSTFVLDRVWKSTPQKNLPWDQCGSVQLLLVRASRWQAFNTFFFLHTFTSPRLVFRHCYGYQSLSVVFDTSVLPLPGGDPLRAPEVPDIRGRTPALWLLPQSKIFGLHWHGADRRRPTDHQAGLITHAYTHARTHMHEARQGECVCMKDLSTYTNTRTHPHRHSPATRRLCFYSSFNVLFPIQQALVLFISQV